MVDAGCEYVFMEVSSHALDQNRVFGVHFVGGIFTNLTHDHLDYHKTFENYLEAKKKFFKMLPVGAFALSNTDNEYGSKMLQGIKAEKFSYGLKGNETFHGEIKTRGMSFIGDIIKADLHRTATIDFKREFFLPKYERKERRFSKIKAHNPACINAKIGDNVKIKETRPLSKTKNFVIVEVFKK
jgi:UDP-N-acetylmuramoyl-L-alanyl-D-glutamate--2,6-diaminopimelate ligase